MALGDDLSRIAAAARAFAAAGEELSGVLAAEPLAGPRIYLCAFSRDGGRAWLALDDGGGPVTRRETVREAASIVALCEIAEEIAGGGRLEELRRQLVALRVTDDPPGIDEAEEAALALERTIGAPPRVASPGWLDAVGAATLALERSLGEDGRSPFAEGIKAAAATVEAFTGEVEDRYKLALS